MHPVGVVHGTLAVVNADGFVGWGSLRGSGLPSPLAGAVPTSEVGRQGFQGGDGKVVDTGDN